MHPRDCLADPRSKGRAPHDGVGVLMHKRGDCHTSNQASQASSRHAPSGLKKLPKRAGDWHTVV